MGPRGQSGATLSFKRFIQEVTAYWTSLCGIGEAHGEQITLAEVLQDIVFYFIGLLSEKKSVSLKDYYSNCSCYLLKTCHFLVLPLVWIPALPKSPLQKIYLITYLFGIIFS